MDGKICTSCQLSRSLDDFYKKGQRLESRCKPCVLAAKAVTYRKSHPRRKSGCAGWKEIIETKSEEPPTLDLELLLRDFMIEVVLDTGTSKDV